MLSRRPLAETAARKEEEMPEPMVAAIDLGDLLEYLIPLLVAAGWILSRLAAVIRGLAGPAAKPPAAPRDLQRE
ncbi:MAG: hypothetical protein ACOYK7_09965, partial [Pirellulales bacterium]